MIQKGIKIVAKKIMNTHRNDVITAEYRKAQVYFLTTICVSYFLISNNCKGLLKRLKFEKYVSINTQSWHENVNGSMLKVDENLKATWEFEVFM